MTSSIFRTWRREPRLTFRFDAISRSAGMRAPGTRAPSEISCLNVESSFAVMSSFWRGGFIGSSNDTLLSRWLRPFLRWALTLSQDWYYHFIQKGGPGRPMTVYKFLAAI